MKYILVLILCMVATCPFLFAQTESLSTIILYWPEYATIRYKVYSNDSLITIIKSRSFIEYNVKPGTLRLYIKDRDSTTLNLSVEKNRTYYIRYKGPFKVMDKYMFYAVTYKIYPPQLTVMDSIEATTYITQNNLKDIQDPESWVRPKFRLDIFMNLGYGPNSFPMVELTDGSESWTGLWERMGGGVGLTYEPYKYFQLSTDINYTSNSLSPDPKNADVLFRVCRWSFTPYLVIPIGKSQHSVKVGIGKDFYLSPSLTIKASSLDGGFDDKWKYSATNGYHWVLMYDLYDNSSGSYTVGFKWYNVNYKYSSGKYIPDDDRLLNPNGSGFVFSIGGSCDLFAKKHKK